MDISKGRYWDKPWSLVSSCTRCSEGCRSCWSLAMEKRFHKGIEGTIITHPERLMIPYRRRKPTTYSLWNDWGHESVTDHFRLLAVQTARDLPRHTFLVLTKRPKKAADFWINYDGGSPPTNWWSGLTICNQQEADEKIPIFLQVPGRKFFSIEPMLGEIDLLYPAFDGSESFSAMGRIDAVILGGETGPGARPLHPDWVRSVRDQCQNAGVPFFFKQWGEWAPSPDGGLPDHLPSSAGYYFAAPDPPGKVWRFGRKTAGRLLDGRTHDDLPWVKV